jgi:hypothetical protein
MFNMCWLLRTPGKWFSYEVHSPRRWSRPTCSFCDTQTASFLEFSIPVSYCFVRWWLCKILGSRTTLYCYNWLGFSKLQDTKSFLFTWKRHVCTPLPPSGETGKYAIASATKTLLHFLYLLACFYLLYLGLLLHGQASKSRMDLWNTLYKEI